MWQSQSNGHHSKSSLLSYAPQGIQLICGFWENGFLNACGHSSRLLDRQRLGHGNWFLAFFFFSFLPLVWKASYRIIRVTFCQLCKIVIIDHDRALLNVSGKRLPAPFGFQISRWARHSLLADGEEPASCGCQRQASGRGEVEKEQQDRDW